LKNLAIGLHSVGSGGVRWALAAVGVNPEEIVKPTLGQYLASIRLDRKMSLRQVEETSNKEVSNAYLSQLETGKILQPSPNVLNTLADIYKIDYVQLMELAGYLPAAKTREATQRHGRIATFAEHNLTPDEEGELMQYLQYLRTKKKP
jgi:HTH-type transcriptional regulator, competence development regulator